MTRTTLFAGAAVVALIGLGRFPDDLRLERVPAWFWYYRHDPEVRRWLGVGLGVNGLVAVVMAAAAALNRLRPLHGAARWAGPGKDFAVAMKKVEERLEEIGLTDRTAWFTSALAVAWPDGPCIVVEGVVDGHLTFPPRGDRGFGYDPLFIPQGGDLTFGEMEPAAKDAISHRSRAFEKLRAVLID